MSLHERLHVCRTAGVVKGRLTASGPAVASAVLGVQPPLHGFVKLRGLAGRAVARALDVERNWREVGPCLQRHQAWCELADCKHQAQCQSIRSFTSANKRSTIPARWPFSALFCTKVIDGNAVEDMSIMGALRAP